MARSFQAQLRMTICGDLGVVLMKHYESRGTDD